MASPLGGGRPEAGRGSPKSVEVAGEEAMARHWAESARRRKPGVTRAEFFESLPVQPGAVRQRIDGALKGLGF